MNWTKENIKVLRKRLGLTQTEFGEQLGYAQPQVRVSELERGEMKPGGAVLRLLDMLDKQEKAPTA